MLHEARQFDYYVKQPDTCMPSSLRAPLFAFENVIPPGQRTTTQRGFKVRLERQAVLRPKDAHLGRQLVEPALAAIKDPQGEGSRTFLAVPWPSTLACSIAPPVLVNLPLTLLGS